MVNNRSPYYVFYDLEYAPTTFNFIYTLVCGEFARRELTKCSDIHFVFVPGSNDGFNKHTYYNADVKKWRFWSILNPALELLPSIKSFTLLANREEAVPLIEAAGSNRFPIGYTIENGADCSQIVATNLLYALGHQLPVLEAPALGLDRIDDLFPVSLRGKGIVTLTMRQAAHVTERNSELDVWQSISAELQNRGYQVVVLPDYDAVMSGQRVDFPGALISNECAINLHLRMALYEAAAINIVENGGPATLCIFSKKCNYIVRRAVVPESQGSNALMTMRLGLAIDKDTSYFDTFARWTWHDGSAEAVLNLCAEYEERTASSRSLTSENLMIPEDVFVGMSLVFDREVLFKLADDHLNRENGPVFVQRENSIDGHRVGVLRRWDGAAIV